MTIRWLFLAVQDLEAVFDYIYPENPAAAAAGLDRINSAVAMLSTNPAMGRPGRVAGTRELVVASTPYIVAYRMKTGQIQILRVLHGARRWPERL